MEQLQSLMELNPEPMLAVSGGVISHMNGAARSRFPSLAIGQKAAEALPAHLLDEEAERFQTTLRLEDAGFCVSALRTDGVLLMTLIPDMTVQELRGCLSDTLLAGMQAALFNITLSAKSISARMDLQSPELKVCFSILNRNCYLLQHRLANLNTFCAMLEGQLEAIPRRTDLAILCRDLAASVNTLCGPQRAAIEYSCPLNSLPAIVDTPKIERLILNLLSNALKHTPADGSIRLRLEKRGGSAAISVSDTGGGIPAARLNQVFRSHALHLSAQDLTNPDDGGLGLGICRAIAEQHGGAIVLESREGEGTTVRVQLPLQPRGRELLFNEGEPYENGGMSLLLSELSDVLAPDVFRMDYMD